ncbi:MAG: hypothetical protein M3Q65_09995 [Chloroflexota bacterium]|nr:hypothetical protein [Chloroflexota bacterium]
MIHSRRERRSRCQRCGRTFSATKGTALCRAHGCPVQAIAVAFGWDGRTVARYRAEAGAQCRRGAPAGRRGRPPP